MRLDRFQLEVLHHCVQAMCIHLLLVDALEIMVGIIYEEPNGKENEIVNRVQQEAPADIQFGVSHFLGKVERFYNCHLANGVDGANHQHHQDQTGYHFFDWHLQPIETNDNSPEELGKKDTQNNCK
jgi:hypothetical protein